MNQVYTISETAITWWIGGASMSLLGYGADGCRAA